MKSLVMKYGVSLAAVALAVGMRWLLDPLLDKQFPYGTLSLAFVFSVWYCGQGPGFMTLLLALVVGTYSFVSPRGWQALVEPANLVGCLIYLCVGLCLLAFARSLRRTHRQLAEAIDQRRRMDDELRDSRTLFESFMEHVPVVAFMKDDEGRYFFVNKELEKTSRMDRGQWAGKSDWEVFDRATAERLRNADAVVMAANEPRTFEMVQTNFGDERTFYWSVVKFPFRNTEGRRFLAGLAMNVTQRKLAEDEVRSSEERFRQLAENITEVFWLIELQNDRLIYISPAYERVWGRSCQSLYDRPQSFLDAIVPDDRARIADKQMAQLRGEGLNEEYRITRPDGTLRWIWDRGFPIKDASGKVVRVAGIAEDITWRKQAEQQLRDSEERFRAIFSQANVGIVECSVDGRFRLANDKFVEILGYPREELLQLNYQDVTHPGDLAACNVLVSNAMLHEQSFTTEKRYLRKDGRVVWVSTAVSVVRDEARQPVFAVVIVEDISDRKEVEEHLLAERTMLRQLYDSTENERKLVSFELHDGPIQYATAALMHIEAYRAKIDDNPAELELARHLIDKTLLESRRLMNGLRPPVLDHSGLVAGISQLILSEFGDTLQVEFDHDQDLGRFAPSLESAVYRIVQEGLTNAYKHSGSDKVRVSLRRHDDHLCLEIEDWGKGFDVHEKGGHRGGLKGFAERVRLAGGILTIDSQPGRGTRIVVELPILMPVKTTSMEEIHA